jgi:hypothetical protein
VLAPLDFAFAVVVEGRRAMRRPPQLVANKQSSAIGVANGFFYTNVYHPSSDSASRACE